MAADPTEGLHVVPPGEGERFANIEFLAQTRDTPRFNLGIVTIEPHREGPEMHSHDDEDDSFYILDGELTMLTDNGEFPAPRGTFVLVPPRVNHGFANRTGEPVRMLNLHAPAGFDVRVRE
jgi:mannose-6-phosphate isomerase-like protein (cupin superfamily)